MLVRGMDRMAQGLQGEFLRLKVVAQNQANLDTAGFRQTLTGIRDQKVLQWRDDTVGASKETQRNLDMQPEPGVYFEVQRDGNTFLTNRGDLQMDQEGYLAVGSGERILDANGSTIKVERLDDVSLNEKGQVLVKGKPIASIGRKTVDKVNELGGTMFTPSADSVVTDSNTDIILGAYQTSNADPTRNQTDLVAVIHRAKVFAQAITLQDQTIERAVRSLLGN